MSGQDDVAEEVFALARNDLEGALALVKKLRKEKRWTPSTAEILVTLFDDPETILAKL